MCAVVRDGGGQLATGYGVKKSLLAGSQKAERCFHIVTPFIFDEKRGFLEVGIFGLIILYLRYIFKSNFDSERRFETFLLFEQKFRKSQKRNFYAVTK